MNVFITVDSEVYPHASRWREAALADDIQRDIYARTAEGEYGIKYQMDVLDAHGLKAVFFLESLFACAVGLGPLEAIVREIQRRGHEVQLHVHTEWLDWIPESILPGRSGYNIREFTLEEQTFLLARAKQNLQNAGVSNVCTYRAGNFGANLDTLTALARNGIRYDTSYNVDYLGRDCDIRVAELLVQPGMVNGVCEFPVSCFRDYPGHFRPTQLTACSAAEMRWALHAAQKQGWNSFVIVTHSFELIHGPRGRNGPIFPDRVVIRRFNELCRFLADNRERFKTCGFCDLAPGWMPETGAFSPPSSNWFRTAWRVGEQLGRRIRARVS